MAFVKVSVINSSAQKVGHIAGVLAYGLTATAATVVAGIVENTLKGLAQTGKAVTNEMRSVPSPQAAPIKQKKAPEAPRRKKKHRKRSGGRKGPGNAQNAQAEQEKAPEAR